MYLLRYLAILCSISVLVCLGFWVMDAVTGMEFHFGWLLFSSILWAFVFEGLYWYLKRKGPPKTFPPNN